LNVVNSFITWKSNRIISPGSAPAVIKGRTTRRNIGLGKEYCPMIIQANNNNLCAFVDNNSVSSPPKIRNNKPLSFLYRNTNPLDYSPKLNANES
jgi:hypothetical protein